MTTRELIENDVANGVYDNQYAQFIIENCGGDRIICNGSTLTEAQESGYLLDAFVDSLM